MSVQPTLWSKRGAKRKRRGLFSLPTRRHSRTRLAAGSLKVLLVGPSLQQKGGMATVQNLVLDSVSASMKINHIATHEEGSLCHRILFFARALVVFVKNLMLNQVSLVHLHVSEKGSVVRKIILLLIAKAFGKPVVVHTHGCEFHLFHDSLPGWGRSLVNVSLRQADCFVVLSESWRRYYIGHCGLTRSRVLVLPNPVDMPAAVPERSGKGTVRIAFLGRVGERKGAFDLIQAFSRLPANCRDRAQLMLAGDGELDRAIALVEQLGISKQVTFMGWLSSAECKQLLANANLFALPSYNEGLPMAVIEAMAWGLPVISTPVGGIPELIDHGETGYLVNPGNIESLMRSMQFLINNSGARESVGRNARARVLPLDINLYCQTLTTLFQLIISEQLAVDRTGSLIVPEAFDLEQSNLTDGVQQKGAQQKRKRAYAKASPAESTYRKD